MELHSKVCRHCGLGIIPSEEDGAPNPWIHNSGFYSCEPFDSGLKAEPKELTEP